MQDYENFINGRFSASTGKDRIEVTNPSTGQVICTVPESSDADVAAAISAAEKAQPNWAKRPAIERAKALFNCRFANVNVWRRIVSSIR